MKELNQYFDHTILKPEATSEEVKKLCREAKTYGFYAVCVNSCYVALAKKELRGSKVKVACVVGFPLGTTATEVKAFEAKFACLGGADEIDMVIQVGALKDKDYAYVKQDIHAVVEAAKEYGSIVKVILETCLLTEEEIEKACQLAEVAGAAFVKTSTGFSKEGARISHVMLMKKTVGDRLQVKASGGIKNYETAMAMIQAGADRIGASASVDIVKSQKS